MTVKNLTKNNEYIEKNRSRLLKEYANKYLLVYNEKIISSFDTYEKAAEEGIRQFGLDEEFLVYYLTEEEPVNFGFVVFPWGNGKEIPIISCELKNFPCLIGRDILQHWHFTYNGPDGSIVICE